MLTFELFDSLIDSVVVIDENRRIGYCNESAAHLAGSSVRRLSKGVEFLSAFNIENGQKFVFGGGEAGQNEALPREEVGMKRLDGSRGVWQITIQPFDNQGKASWLIIMHDVSLEESLHGKYQGELEQKEVYIKELQSAKDQLELYSKNLEKMVEERTAEVRHANRLLNAIMDSLGQGFLVFQNDGRCLPIYTKACEDILEVNPAGKLIQDVLKLSTNDLSSFSGWLSATFTEALPFESMIELAPQIYPHSQKRHITLSYYPIRDEAGAIANVVLVATDRTRENEANKALLKEQKYIQMVMKILRGRDQFNLYLKSVREVIQRIKSDLLKPGPLTNPDEFYRSLHTLEGESGLFSVHEVWQAARDCQEQLSFLKDSDQSDEALTKFRERVADLELRFDSFLRENQGLLETLRVGGTRNIEIALPILTDFMNQLRQQKVSRDVLIYFCEKIYRQPLDQSLRHYDEVAQHVAASQGKRLRKIEFDCSDVKIPPGSLEGLISSLVHAFRNAVDHGIEAPEERIQIGKAEAGVIRVSARYKDQDGQRWIRIEIEDDGRGVSPDAIRRKLGEKFPGEDFSQCSDFQVIQQVFRPQFSSRETVSEFSGRGVGMDAIKTEVERINGQVVIQSQLGRGSRLVIDIPDPVQTEPIALSA